LARAGNFPAAQHSRTSWPSSSTAARFLAAVPGFIIAACIYVTLTIGASIHGHLAPGR